MSDLRDDVAWFLDSLDDPPATLHRNARHVEPESALGTPQEAADWRRWLELPPWAKARVVEQVACHHPIRRDGVCAACASYGEDGRPLTETGVVARERGRYRWPMRRALDVVRRFDVPPGLPPLDVALRALAMTGNLADAVSLLARQYPAMGHPRFAVRHMRRALKKVRRVYATHPSVRWTAKSEAQQAAEVNVG